MMLEKVQRRPSKFILGDYRSEYRQILTDIQLLLIMMIFELNDIMSFVRQVKFPSSYLTYLIIYLLTISVPDHHISS